LSVINLIDITTSNCLSRPVYKALKNSKLQKFKMGNYIGRVEFLNRKDKNHRIKAEFYKDDQIFAGE